MCCTRPNPADASVLQNVWSGWSAFGATGRVDAMYVDAKLRQCMSNRNTRTARESGRDPDQKSLRLNRKRDIPYIAAPNNALLHSGMSEPARWSTMPSAKVVMSFGFGRM
jgi:hypothetical protein